MRKRAVSTENYHKSIVAAADRTTAFDAVTKDVGLWWTRPDHPLKSLGDRARFTFPPGRSYWTFELSGVTIPDRVEWTCVEALHLHEGQPKEIETEWLGTKVHWTLADDPGGTRITLEHAGLTPQLLCYDVCEAGWDFFFLKSLQQFLDTGNGSPHGGTASGAD